MSEEEWKQQFYASCNAIEKATANAEHGVRRVVEWTVTETRFINGEEKHLIYSSSTTAEGKS